MVLPVSGSAGWVGKGTGKAPERRLVSLSHPGSSDESWVAGAEQGGVRLLGQAWLLHSPCPVLSPCLNSTRLQAAQSTPRRGW